MICINCFSSHFIKMEPTNCKSITKKWLLTGLIMGPIHAVSVVGGLQLVGCQFQCKDLLVDLNVRSAGVHLHLRVWFLGCQTVSYHLQAQGDKWEDAKLDGAASLIADLPYGNSTTPLTNLLGCQLPSLHSNTFWNNHELSERRCLSKFTNYNAMTGW